MKMKHFILIFVKEAIFRLSLMLIFFLILTPSFSNAEEKILNVDVRPRPPEMIVEKRNIYGPLIEIVEVAAARAGYKPVFASNNFDESMRLLQIGKIDIIPRTVWTKERAERIDFIGPLGVQKKDIIFLVKPGKEDTIRTYDDLKKFRVGAKKGTAYFDKFDKDKGINKIESLDDDNMVKMFDKDRFDTMIVLDRGALEKALSVNKITQYAFAKYVESINLELYYGLNPLHKDKENIKKAFLEMARSGEIVKIYKKHGIDIGPVK
ncbi:MAG: ABC transporter substrate-binding protein [Oligoflexales bacterium]|nr:ABC transporter substrate-binding protein [Oligoflexales bacterium]